YGVQALGCRIKPSRALALSVIIGAASEPLMVFDVSFLLSASATLGLLAVGSPLASRCRTLRFRSLRWLAQGLIVTASAMLACAPFLAMFSPRLTAAGALANLLAAPLGEAVALPLCLGHVLVGVGPLDRGISLVASGALLAVKKLAYLSAESRALAFGVPLP